MDLSKMTNREVQNEALGHSGDIGVHESIDELARRLEEAEAKLMLEIDSAEKDVRRRVRATNAMNAAKEVRSE